MNTNPEVPSYPKGLEGVIAAPNGLSYIDGQNGILEYLGIPIEVLAEKSSFEEVCFLLLHQHLPTLSEYQAFVRTLAHKRDLPPFLMDLLKRVPPSSHPMDVLRTMVSALSFYDPGLEEEESERLRKAIRLISIFPVIVAYFHRSRQGKDPVPPREDLSLAKNFLYMLRGEPPQEDEGRIMDIALILHADHGLNASTFACMVTASTLSDMYSSITTGIGTLKGPLHGGANEAVIKMLKEIGREDQVEFWVDRAIASKKKIMGFGHRVYKAWDPRAKILKRLAEELTKKQREEEAILYRIAVKLEKTVLDRMGKEKRIYPNVDFYSGIVYHYLGIPDDLFTPIFAIARVPGWCAHIIEYVRDNRIFRPKGLYVGPRNAPYISFQERGS